MPGQTLSLSQQQQLQMVLAPQLRQSLEMLQVPILELRTMIRQELEQNPTIEEVLQDAPTVEIEPDPQGPADNSKELDFEKEFEVLTRLDDEWRDYFYQNLQNSSYNPESEERRRFLFESQPQRESLQEHLTTQLHLSGLSEADRATGELIIGSINDDGYLVTPLEELAASANVDLKHLQDVHSVILDFHPTGVGARSLGECLMLQLERLDQSHSLAARIVDAHLESLAARRFAEIARALGATVDEVQEAARAIGRLDPKPGRIFSDEISTYVLPEVLVQKVDGEFVVILNDDQLPHIRISKYYRSLLNEANTEADVKSYVRDRIRSGAFLIKSIHQRQRTIQRIATEIVRRQTPFLDKGIAHLKPLTMAEVARVVGVHETTVSRAVSGKYMQIPGGIFEMKYFFTPGIRMNDGSQVSNKTVKDMIANMVAAEDPDHPLSDQEIVDRLKHKGVKIARRTVAKYRLVLHIPPSHMRKGL